MKKYEEITIGLPVETMEYLRFHSGHFIGPHITDDSNKDARVQDMVLWALASMYGVNVDYHQP